jgi:hypothetical protein
MELHNFESLKQEKKESKPSYEELMKRWTFFKDQIIQEQKKDPAERDMDLMRSYGKQKMDVEKLLTESMKESEDKEIENLPRKEETFFKKSA